MVDYEYPVGIPTHFSLLGSSASDKREDGALPPDAKCGIYNVEYTAPLNIAHSMSPTRESGALKWNLGVGSGWYSSVDVDNMLSCGYIVSIKEGYYWTKTAPIFRDYINDLFKAKQESKKGTATYTLAKLFMNALYGKTIQRPIYTQTALISSNLEFWKFWAVNTIDQMTKVGDRWHLAGNPRDGKTRAECITKPTHLGVFILAYSRKIMMNYMKEANPSFTSGSEDFYYTDTDSLQMHAKNAHVIKRFGDTSLGGITDDLGDARILRGIWVAPKLYALEYVKESTGTTLHYHIRGKGLNIESLNIGSFESMNCGESLISIRPFMMKKVHIKRTSNESEIEQFSILYKENISKVVNKTPWAGRSFCESGMSVPLLGVALY